jgi:hypothetical protein
MIYSLVVEGLIFAQTDVFGKYLPSRSSIEDVMSRFEDINRTNDENRVNKQRFCSLNYTTVVELDKSFNPTRNLTELENINIVLNYQEWLTNIETRKDKPAFLELSVMYQRNLDRMCQLTGHDFYCVIQDNFVIAWYGYLIGNSGHIGDQKFKRELEAILKVAEGRKPISLYKPIGNRDEYCSRLRDYEDLGLADKRFSEFTDAVSNLAKSNDEMSILVLAQHEVTLRLTEIVEKSPKRSVPFLCRFCNNISDIIRGGKTPSSCTKCKNEGLYKQDWEKNNRPPTQQDPIGWVIAFDGKRMLCEGVKCDDGYDEVGRLRQVNAECICRECYRESIGR